MAQQIVGSHILHKLAPGIHGVQNIAGGPSCKEFKADCQCCKRWAALDVLTDDPWEENDG